VTRISLGVQSLVPRVLAGLGRLHDPAAVTRAARAVTEVSFLTWNADLIFGAAVETDDDWRRSLDGVLALGAPHVSAYALTVEPGTPLAADPARHPDDDVQAGRYVMADDVLGGAGLDAYEVSNWARPGHECRHNLLYWAQGDYRGIGCAAHSHRSGHRWWNVRTPARYIELVSAGASPVAGEERLDDPTRSVEAVTLGLRTRHGVAAARVAGPALDELAEAGLVSRMGERIVLTRRGRLLANEVAVRLT
jgi:oxygen-independent coproporphyrinogen-3 oxidase